MAQAYINIIAIVIVYLFYTQIYKRAVRTIFETSVLRLNTQIKSPVNSTEKSKEEDNYIYLKNLISSIVLNIKTTSLLKVIFALESNEGKAIYPKVHSKLQDISNSKYGEQLKELNIMTKYFLIFQSPIIFISLFTISKVARIVKYTNEEFIERLYAVELISKNNNDKNISFA